MNPELAYFEWFRCPKGYRIANSRDVAPEADRDEEWIVPNSDERVMYQCPMNDTAPLATVFANVRTPKGLLAFVKQYGPVTSRGRTIWGVEPIPGCLRRAQQFRELLLCKEKGPRKVAALYNAQLRAALARADAEIPDRIESEYDELYEPIGTVELLPDHARGVRLRLTADTLVGAMLWQLGLKLSRATTFRECRQCGIPFEAGPGTNVRKDSTFCCAEHSVLFHSRRRRKEFKNA